MAETGENASGASAVEQLRNTIGTLEIVERYLDSEVAEPSPKPSEFDEEIHNAALLVNGARLRLTELVERIRELL